MPKDFQKAILICGPTASGKSDLALSLARDVGGEIVCADSMQFYKDLPLLSAAPTEDEMTQVPHHLFSILDPDKQMDVGRYQNLANEAIEDILSRNKIPIIVGGTGFYVQVLMQGISKMPDISPDIRTEATKLYDTLGEDNFRAALSQFDPKAVERILPNDRQRLIRAYEVYLATDMALSDWQAMPKKGRLDHISFLPILFDLPRAFLYQRCDQRFIKMIESNAEENVQRLLALNPQMDWPIWRILGAREIANYLSYKISLDEAITKAQQATRNYAKRQMTWFRNQLPHLISKDDLGLIKLSNLDEISSTRSKTISSLNI
jgi:tRNA dimethylallyltransferase